MTTCAVVLIALLAAPAIAWDTFAVAGKAEPAAAIVPAQMFEGEAVPETGVEVDALMQQMGAPPEVAMMLNLLGQADMDPLMMMMLMGMMEGRGMDEDLMGMLLFSKMLQPGTSQPAPPTTVLKDDMLLIVEDGVVYKIDVTNMSLAGTVIYRQKAAQANPLGALLPLMMLGRAGARPTPTPDLPAMTGPEPVELPPPLP